MTDLESRAVGELPALRAAPSSVLRAVRMVVFDFDGVFTDDAVYVSEQGRESVRCWRGDGLGLRKLDALGIDTMILSTEVNPVVGLRARKLRIKCHQGLDDKRAVLTRIASEAGVKKHGLTPIARIMGGAAAGVPPRIMGIGPVPASQKLMARLGMTQDQFDVIELNEAFASQGLAVLRELGIADDDPRVNRNGGAIALGHPLGMSGARITGTAALELKLTGGRYSLSTMCIGVGQGIAIALERA